MSVQRIHSRSWRAHRVAGAILGFLALAAAGCATTLHLSSDSYPRTARTATVDDYFGVRVADPYRWLEVVDARQTSEWIAAQNALAEPLLHKLPHRAWLQNRLTQLYSYERFGVPEQAGGNYFFLRNDGQQNQAALHVSRSPDDLGRRLIEPDTLRGDATVSLADYVPSPDGRLLAFALSDSGSDWKTWHVRDVETGADHIDVLRDTKFTRVAWARDSSGFYYGRYPGGDDQRQPEIFFHRLGDAQATDRHVFSVTDHPRRTPEVRVSEDGRLLVITIDDGTLANGVSVMDLATGKVEPVFATFDGLNAYIGSRGVAGPGGQPSTELLFSTTSGARRGRIVAVDMARAASDRLRVVVPEGPDVLQGASLVGDRVIASWLTDAHAQVAMFAAADGRRLGDVELPGLGSVGGFSGENSDTRTFFSYADFATPARIYALDTRTGATTLLREPQFAGDVTPYVTEQVFFHSKDGTRVPMFIVHRRDLVRDGTTPAMLYGYGGFDISMTPSFAPVDDRVARDGRHLRGGEPARRRRVRRRLARGRNAHAQAERLRRLHRGGGVSGRREVHATGAADDPRGQQRRAAGRRRAHAATRTVRGGASRRRRARHAALPPRERQRATLGGRLRAVGGRGRFSSADRVLTLAQRRPAPLLPADADHHRSTRQPGRAVAQLQVRRGAAGRAAVRLARPHPGGNARRARQRQADVDADRALRAGLRVRRCGDRNAATAARGSGGSAGVVVLARGA